MKPKVKNTTDFFEYLAKVIFVVLIALTPLLYSTNTSEQYAMPKTFFVYLCAATMFFLFTVSKILFTKKFDLKFGSSPVIFFVIVNVIATALSTHVYTSVWGYYSRFNGGLTSVISFYLVYLVILNLKKFKFTNKYLFIIIFSAIPVAVFAVAQHFAFDPGTRAYSTIGQANWLAAYLAMIIPIVLYFLLQLKSYTKFRVFLIVVFATLFAALWYTYSLSGLLGLGTALIVFLVLNLKEIRLQPKLLIILSLIMVTVAISDREIYKNRVADITTDLEKITTQSEIETIDPNANIISDPGFIRTNMWKGTLNLVRNSKLRILTGHGPETFPYVFQKYRPQELNYSSEWNFILNKPHNYYLEILVELGLVGLVAKLYLMYYIIKSKNKKLLAGFVAYFVTNFFGWPTTSVELLFWVYLAKLDIS